MTSTAVLVLEKTVLETATAMTECLENIDRYSCLFSRYSSGLLEIGLQCGSDYIQFAENTAAQCTTNEDGEFCFRVFQGTYSHHCCRHWLESTCKIYETAHSDLHAHGNKAVVQECNSLMVLAAVARQRLASMDLKVKEATVSYPLVNREMN